MPDACESEPFDDAEAARVLRGGAVGALLDPRSPYVLVRFLMLRLLGVVYLMAFLVAARQAVPLIGEHGLLPVPRFLEAVHAAYGSGAEAFVRLPTLFWIGYSDRALVAVSWLGVLLSAAVVAGVTNAGVQLVLWLLYLSIVQIGQRFYGFGWESQLLETGFLAAFLCPLRAWRPFASPPPPMAIWLNRWLIVRIMLGAGLIKIRGDACWRDLTCLVYHYQSQPNPNPLSPLFHAAPEWFQRVSTAFNHLVELGAPWFAFGPRRVRLVAGTLFVSFQALLILSGNLSFLNWLTLVPALACFDDAALVRLVPRRIRDRFAAPPREASPASRTAAWAFAFVVGALSINPVVNLISPKQAMNQSFDPLHLVNTYGAFGSVTRVRHEVILEGTKDSELGPATRWEEYEFPCKPGDVRRRPCWASPYHYRLDWQMWFAALSSPSHEPWIVHLADKLLRGDPKVRGLLARDPFGDAPPHYVRAQLYVYEMTRPLDASGAWWRRTPAGTYFPPLALGDPVLEAFLARRGWEE